MWREFVKIIGAVQVRQPETEALQSAITKCAHHQQADTLLDDMEPGDKSPGDCREYQALYTLCKACVYYESKLILALENAFDSAQNASEGFRSCGDHFNEGLSYRVLGNIYKKQDKPNQAIAAFNRAKKIFEQRARLYEGENDFKKEAACERQIRACKVAIQGINNKDSSTGASTGSQTGKDRRSPWEAARITFSVYDFGHASRVGKFVLDDEPISEVTIEEILIDSKVYKLYCAQENYSEITLVPGNNYRWLCVSGQSMNISEPTAIEPGDYVLTDTNRQANIGDIVFASLRNPPTPAGRAGVIKRLAGKELRSESTEKIEPIPIAEAKVSGVVIAIAKPAKK